jgi:DNA-binding NarL/FixJ family response regulator
VPIRILLVDDHPLVRKGLRSTLEGRSDLVVVGEAENAAAALEQATLLRPDVVLLDIRMKGASGIAIIHRLKAELPNVKVSILTTYEEEAYLFEALKEGADGYLLKTLSTEELVELVRRLYRGENLLTASLTGKLMQRFQTLAREREVMDSSLTTEEIKILEEIARGATNREIADKLAWSTITVKRKTAQIFKKLDATNRAQAVTRAIRKGLIEG